MCDFGWWKKACAGLVICAAMAMAAHAQTFETLSFDGTNGAFPANMSLAQGRDGNLYGTAASGGAYGSGTVFRIASKNDLRVYSFCSQSGCPDGVSPEAALVLAADGAFYGTTGDGGGTDARGTVFRITANGNLTTLYRFCSEPNCIDGAVPSGPLIQATDRNFYGTTGGGGVHGEGTIFKITPAGTLTTLYSFCPGPDCLDGTGPAGGLVQATDGNFYGITQAGGTQDSGTVFRLTPQGSLTTLYNFCAQPNCADGWGPQSGLVQATDGNLYGTTVVGGANLCYGDGCGTFFKITLGGTLTTLYNFCPQPSCPDGYLPQGRLIQGSDGNFYGTTDAGGTGAVGTIFEITAGGTLMTLHSFDVTGGADPQGDGLFQSTSGILYGTTIYGGDLTCQLNFGTGCGTVFSLDTGLGPFVAFVQGAGKVGQTGGILGQGFTGTTSVSLNGTPANFTVVSDTFIEATVPAGATTGYVTVTTPTRVLTSNVPFQVIK